MDEACPPPTLASLRGGRLSITRLRELWFILTIPVSSNWWQGGLERSYCRLYSCHQALGSPSEQQKGSGEGWGGMREGGR